MAVKAGWDNEEKTVVRYEFSGAWTWEEFENALEVAFMLIESVPQTVDVIANMQRSSHIPGGALIYAKRALMVAPANQGLVIVAHPNAEVHRHLKMFNRIYKPFAGRIVLADTLAEAREMLANNTILSMLRAS